MLDPASTVVFGPAYLDRVIRVDRPLLDPALGLPPVDRSVDGRWVDSQPVDSIRLVDPLGASITIDPPTGWPGLVGTIALARPFAERVDLGTNPHRVRGVSWRDDLGGMGAGYASSLDGTLISALGPPDDPTTRVVEALVGQAGFAHEPIRIPGQTADWTLLISSGAHGDKLAVGFRGCHAAWEDPGPWADRPARVRVVAGLPNRLARWALSGPEHPSGTLRAFFPAARNMLDQEYPLSDLANDFALMSCNRGEWDLGTDLNQLEHVVDLIAITDGSRGATLRFRAENGSRQQIEVPAFPRVGPIVDTNRAGEAFASTLLRTLVAANWEPGRTTPDLARHAIVRASAAAALVLARSDFGFPTADEIDQAVARGVA